MKKLLTSILAGAAVATVACTGAATAGAATMTSSDTPSPEIIGGSYANADWAVQLVFNQNGGTYGCTGEAISDSWVLTAQHCVDETTSMNVYYSNDTRNRGPAIRVDQFKSSSNGDVALVHLSQPKRLSSYPQLADSYTARAGDTGTIYGYGLRANRQQADHLYKADVDVLGRSTDAYGGSAVHIQGDSGASNHGDSGGPLFVNGRIVGVCSTGDEVDPGANPQATSNYANLTASRSWIRSVSGV
ncbi:S1 family peptidase [Acaricomes phytoseiuli]|uniref:S1 family peptidase n=1 Tax=Acaricomes phytoseiuli TaxID=291968 RepID=UPI002223D26F|nr:S1 family peptidase [Acaricomes phytoseiuli]MCW1250129.1 S1 family peptidase [Acaricomes phytoseiuli]